jgi:hypothetical protein
MGDRLLRARAITCPIVRLDSGSSRGFACLAQLRPRCARLTPLTSPRSSPVLGTYVMAGGSWSLAHRNSIQHIGRKDVAGRRHVRGVRGGPDAV